MSDSNFKWGDQVMILGLRYEDEYCDVRGSYRQIVVSGTKKGKHLIAIPGVVQNFFVDAERLCLADEYYERLRRGVGFLPPHATGRLFFMSPVESEGTRGDLLSQLITGEGDKENGTKTD